MLLECTNARSVQPTVLTDENERDATQRNLGMWIYQVLEFPQLRIKHRTLMDIMPRNDAKHPH